MAICAGIFALALMLVEGTAVSSAAATTEFAIRDPATGETLLKGEEYVRRDGADIVKRTVYRTQAGQEAETEDVRYGAASLRLDHYRFEDKATGELATVKVSGDQAAVQYRAARDANLKSDVIPWSRNAVSGKELPELILNGWTKLLAGETLSFDLYVPFRLETITFRAALEETANGTATKSVVVEPSSWLIRLVAPSIEFVFDGTPEAPKLLKYKGPAMVDIKGEKNRDVEIDFK